MEVVILGIGTHTPPGHNIHTLGDMLISLNPLRKLLLPGR